MGFFDFNPMFIEKYEGGLPNTNGPKDIQITFKTKEGVIELKTIEFLGGSKFLIRPEQVVEIGLDQNSYRHAGKTAKGAIIGGLLTGGVGLIAGAALGGKRRTENKLTLVLNINNFDHHVFIKPSGKTQQLYTEFVNFLSKFPKPIDNKPPQQQIQTTETKQLPQTDSQPIDVAEQLEKLHSLMEKGIITNDEFDSQKKKLLS